MYSLLDLFCNATGMEFNIEKSHSYIYKVQPEFIRKLKNLFQVKIDQMETGFKYLGFYLKHNNYRVNDWFWLLKKIGKGISNCSYIFLSLGGRLTLMKATLQSIHVYWCSLVKLPASIINAIRENIFYFL